MELLEADRKWLKYSRKDWELKKMVPYPLDIGSSFRKPYTRKPSFFGDTDKVLEYWRVYTEEIEARAAKGVGREEKIRLLWVGGRPVYQDLMGLLDAKGVSVPAMMLPSSVYFGVQPSLLRSTDEMNKKLTPLEEEADQWLAHLPDTGLPHLGAQRILPVRRSLRLPGSVAGFDGPDLHRASYHARAPSAMRCPSVPGWRCLALVASAIGKGCTHAQLR